jgi:hypothetical protein
MAEKARVYGAADEANRDPPPSQGMRGEQTAPLTRDGQPELSHAVTLENGKRVVVSEDSGVAYAEATGRAGRVATAIGPEPEPEPEPEMVIEVELEEPRRSRMPVLLAIIGAVVIGGYLLARRGRAVRLDKTGPTPDVLLLPGR